MLFSVFNTDERINVIRKRPKPGTKYKNAIRNYHNGKVKKEIPISRIYYKYNYHMESVNIKN